MAHRKPKLESVQIDQIFHCSIEILLGYHEIQDGNPEKINNAMLLKMAARFAKKGLSPQFVGLTYQHNCLSCSSNNYERSMIMLDTEKIDVPGDQRFATLKQIAIEGNTLVPLKPTARHIIEQKKINRTTQSVQQKNIKKVA